MTEPKIIQATLRVSDDINMQHIECRFDDGQKFAAVMVDIDMPELAESICEFLNTLARH